MTLLFRAVCVYKIGVVCLVVREEAVYNRTVPCHTRVTKIPRGTIMPE